MFVVDVSTFGPAAYFLWFVEFWCTSRNIEGSVLTKGNALQGLLFADLLILVATLEC